jgi:dipeptidyl aminopeptidase/acylaminoacyl peptidase
MSIPIAEKYEFNGQPSRRRSDLVPPEGWNLSLITSIQRIYNHQLSPDGKRLAFFWHKEDLADLYVMPAKGGWPQRFTTKRPSQPYWLDEIPQWSLDGHWLAISVGDQVHIVNSFGGLPRELTLPLKESSLPIWLPDSDHLVITITVDDAPRLFLTDRCGSFARALTCDKGSDFDPHPSPDGRSIVFVHWPDNDLNRRDIRLIDLERGITQIISGTPKVKEWAPRWSHDGKRIAFLSQRTEFNQIWLMDPDGQDRHQLTDYETDIFEIAWSPDDTHLVCTINRQGRRDLVMIDVQTGMKNELKKGEGLFSHPQWSPDGRSISVEYESSIQPPDINIIDTTDGKQTQVTFSNPPALARNQQVIPEVTTYQSFDGLEINALILKPRQSNGAAVLLAHGGPAEQYEFHWEIFPQYLVAKGYTLLMPNYRGSTGFGLRFEHKNYNDWGGGDVKDCLYGADYLVNQYGIDPTRVGMFGESYGGYLTNCCLITDQQNRFACGISVYGDADLFLSWSKCNGFIRRYTEMQIGNPSINRKVYQTGSVIDRVGNIRKPLLLLHGLEDDIVPPEASEVLAQALQHNDKVFEYKTYAGEPHGFQKRSNLQDAYERMERFFDWYLMVPLLEITS